MIALDVNVVLSAMRTDADDHEDMRGWLQQSVDDAELVGVSDAVSARSFGS